MDFYSGVRVLEAHGHTKLSVALGSCVNLKDEIHGTESFRKELHCWLLRRKKAELLDDRKRFQELVPSRGTIKHLLVWQLFLAPTAGTGVRHGQSHSWCWLHRGEEMTGNQDFLLAFLASGQGQNCR